MTVGRVLQIPHNAFTDHLALSGSAPPAAADVP